MAHDLKQINRLIAAIQANLSDDLRKPIYRGRECALSGHCYVAAESLYSLLGGSKSGWVPHFVSHEGGPHWYLKHRHSGVVLDPTKEQFDTPVDYSQGIGKGFLTKEPSKRAQVVLDRIANGGVSLAKNIGFVTFPNLGEGSVHTMPMTVTPEKYSAYRAISGGQKDASLGGMGTIWFNRSVHKPTLENRRFLRGAVRGYSPTEMKFKPLDTATRVRAFGLQAGKTADIHEFMAQIDRTNSVQAGKGLVGNEGHEGQHVVFARLAQRFGNQRMRQIIDAAHASLPPEQAEHINRLWDTARPAGGGYGPEEVNEEKITHLQNYLMDPTWRHEIHQRQKISKDLPAQRASIQLARKAWQSLQRWGQMLQPHEVGISKAEVETGPRRVASVAVFNSDGALLMGKRIDNGRWNCPGGKLEVGETPETGARREVKEETGLEIRGLKFLGKGRGGRDGDIEIYCYEAKSDDRPDGKNDPDEECDDWEWVNVAGGLPDEFKHSLHNHDNDVLLQHLGLQSGKIDGTKLEKSWKHMFAGAIAAAGIATSAMGQDAEKHPEVHAAETWSSKGLHEELLPVAQLESSGGKNMNHAPHPKGAFHTAVGALGLKPVTAHDEYTKTPWLQKIFPNLSDPEKFTAELKSNNALYNHVATSHWLRLKKMFGGDRLKAAFAWRWGMGAATRDTLEVQAGDPYVQAYQKMWDAAQAKKVGDALLNPLAKAELKTNSKKQEFDHYSVRSDLTELDPKLQGTGSMGMERNRPKRIPRAYVYHANTAPETHIAAAARAKYRVELPVSAKLYDLGEDDHELMTPTVRHTPHGIFYEPVDLDDVEKKIKRLGYVGYRNYQSNAPNAVALFIKVKARLMK